MSERGAVRTQIRRQVLIRRHGTEALIAAIGSPSIEVVHACGVQVLRRTRRIAAARNAQFARADEHGTGIAVERRGPAQDRQLHVAAPRVGDAQAIFAGALGLQRRRWSVDVIADGAPRVESARNGKKHSPGRQRKERLRFQFDGGVFVEVEG